MIATFYVGDKPLNQTEDPNQYAGYVGGSTGLWSHMHWVKTKQEALSFVLEELEKCPEAQGYVFVFDHMTDTKAYYRKILSLKLEDDE